MIRTPTTNTRSRWHGLSRALWRHFGRYLQQSRVRPSSARVLRIHKADMSIEGLHA